MAALIASGTRAFFGRTITYTRKDVTPVSLSDGATVNSHDYEINGNDNFPTLVQFWDWTITAADLGLTPRQGDRITETVDGTTSTYEVLPIDKRPVFEALDTAGILLKIHTKKVG